MTGSIETFGRHPFHPYPEEDFLISRYPIPLRRLWSLSRWLMWCSLLFSLGCASPHLVDSEFVEEYRGYRFALPGGEWPLDPEAWSYAEEFGFRLVPVPPTQRYRRESWDRKVNDINRYRRPILKFPEEKQLFEVDVGFTHRSEKMKILVASTAKSELVALLRRWKFETMSEVPEDLIRAYLEIFPQFHSVSVSEGTQPTQRSFSQLGKLHRLEFQTARETLLLYGMPLKRDVLLFQLRADKGVAPSLWQEGVQTLEDLIGSSSVF